MEEENMWWRKEKGFDAKKNKSESQRAKVLDA